MNIKTKPAEIIWDDANFSIDLVTFVGYKKMQMWQNISGISSGSGISMTNINTQPGNILYHYNASQPYQLTPQQQQAVQGISASLATQGKQSQLQGLQNQYNSTLQNIKQLSAQMGMQKIFVPKEKK